MQEEVLQGEKVRKFIVEGKTSAGWNVLTEGSCIGHKFLAKFAETEVSRLRLVMQESAGIPLIKEFSAHNFAIAE